MKTREASSLMRERFTRWLGFQGVTTGWGLIADLHFVWLPRNEDAWEMNFHLHKQK